MFWPIMCRDQYFHIIRLSLPAVPAHKKIQDCNLPCSIMYHFEELMATSLAANRDYLALTPGWLCLCRRYPKPELRSALYKRHLGDSQGHRYLETSTNDCLRSRRLCLYQGDRCPSFLAVLMSPYPLDLRYRTISRPGYGRCFPQYSQGIAKPLYLAVLARHTYRPQYQ